jgi:hypothetical protein
MKTKSVALWIAVFGVIAGSAIKGCEYFPESTFQLANDSRLPEWVVLPQGLTRSDVSITMNYYIKPSGRTATFILQDTRKQVLTKVVGKAKCNEPFRIKVTKQESGSDYPSYELITVNDISEVVEHRRMEPIFYISDDAAVRKEISSAGCG